MSRAASLILKAYLNDPTNRELQLLAFGAFESHLNDVADVDVTLTDLTVQTKDLEVMLMWLVVLNDDLREAVTGEFAAKTLRRIRGYLNLIYQICHLNRSHCLAAYQTSFHASLGLVK